MPVSSFRVVVADKHPLMCYGLSCRLQAESDFDVAGEAQDGDEVLELLDREQPDVLVIDMDIPGASILRILQHIKDCDLGVRTLVYSARASSDHAASLHKNGAAGYLTKSQSVHFLVEAVRTVARGRSCWSVMPGATPLLDGLTDRELEILSLAACGHTNRSIAADLFISDHTVRNHMCRIYEKVGVTSSREAVAWAWRNGLVLGQQPSMAH